MRLGVTINDLIAELFGNNNFFFNLLKKEFFKLCNSFCFSSNHSLDRDENYFFIDQLFTIFNYTLDSFKSDFTIYNLRSIIKCLLTHKFLGCLRNE